jgi:hypothetical protein
MVIVEEAAAALLLLLCGCCSAAVAAVVVLTLYVLVFDRVRGPSDGGLGRIDAVGGRCEVGG